MGEKLREVNMIVASGKDGAIGRGGDLIWHLPGDLKRFKSLTMGHPIIMGRKTWESLPKKPLPGRLNIVLTNQKEFPAEGAIVVHSVDEALAQCKTESPFIIGGAQIYNLFLPYVTNLYLTEVDSECKDADAFLNIDLKNEEWKLIKTTEGEEIPSGPKYRYSDYIKTEIR